jgi:hypothetical protein
MPAYNGNIICYQIYIKAVTQHTYEGEGGERIYSSYSFQTSALDGGEWSASRPVGTTLMQPVLHVTKAEAVDLVTIL